MNIFFVRMFKLHNNLLDSSTGILFDHSKRECRKVPEYKYISIDDGGKTKVANFASRQNYGTFFWSRINKN